MSDLNPLRGSRQTLVAANHGNTSSSSNASDTFSTAADDGSEGSHTPGSSYSLSINNQPHVGSEVESPESRAHLFAHMRRDPWPQATNAMNRNGSYVPREMYEYEQFGGPGALNADGRHDQHPMYEGRLTNDSFQAVWHHTTDNRSRPHELYPVNGRHSVTEPRRIHTGMLSNYVSNDMPFPGLAGIRSTSEHGAPLHQHRTDDGYFDQTVISPNLGTMRRHEAHPRELNSSMHLSTPATQASNAFRLDQLSLYGNLDNYNGIVEGGSSEPNGVQPPSLMDRRRQLQEAYGRSEAPTSTSSGLGTSQNQHEEEYQEYFEDEFPGYPESSRSR